MNNKYNEMYKNILEIFYEYGLKIMPGKTVANEICEDTMAYSHKDFFLLPEDMNKLETTCAKKLENHGYEVEFENSKNGKICRIFRPDIFATTIFRLMKTKPEQHCPQIIIRGLTENGGKYQTVLNGRTVCFDAVLIDHLEKVEYKDSHVYAKKNINDYLKDVYGDGYELVERFSGYTLTGMSYPPEKFLSEAKKRGYLTDAKVSRYKEHRKWKKENRSKIEEKYNEYQDVLLGLK